VNEGFFRGILKVNIKRVVFSETYVNVCGPNTQSYIF
jgi:hypothetical protein